MTDSGLYTASVNGTNRKQSIKLEIMPYTEEPMIEKYPQNIVIEESKPLQIDCLVRTMSPYCDVTWTLYPECGGSSGDARKVENNARCRLTATTAADSCDQLKWVHLSIEKADPSDAGDYVLRCENKSGSSSVKIPVTIIRATHQIQAKMPRFTESLKKEIMSCGVEPVILKCKIEGNPSPKVRWTKDGCEVLVSDFITINSLIDKHELCIYNPRLNDSGTYAVEASNSYGSDRCQCLVRVIGPCCTPLSGTISPTCETHQESNPITSSQRTQLIFSNSMVSSPPQFQSTFKDETVEEGDDVTLKCCLIGEPEPVVWWTYNTHLLKNPRFTMSRNSNEYTLSVNNIKEEDTGRYSMTAENSIGLATCSALVIVNKDGRQPRPLDKSQYKVSSKPINVQMHRRPLHRSTNLSHIVNPSLPDESRIMQVSPSGRDEHRQKLHTNNLFDYEKPIEIEDKSANSIDFSKSKTKTIKTYHYSGPSGVSLPGIGFIPKLNPSRSQTPSRSISPSSRSPSPLLSCSSSSSSSSSEVHLSRAVFVPGINPNAVNGSPNNNTTQKIDDQTRFSFVESSECDDNF